MRAAAVALLPGEHLHVHALLGWIAGEVHGLVVAVVAPLDLVGRQDGERARIAAAPGGIRLGDLDVGRRSDTGDQIGAAFLLGAVPMHIVGVVDAERALGDPRRVRRIDHRTGPRPGGALDHGDIAVVRMVMRVAEAAGFEAVDVDVDAASLVRIADQDGLVGGGLHGRVAPLELVGRHIGDG